jgi:uncharacterized membrane-anchored protein
MLLALCPGFVRAAETNQTTESVTNAKALRHARILKQIAGLRYQTGTINLRDGLATVNLTNGFEFLPSADARVVVEDIWGNPPGSLPLGMIVPEGRHIVGSNSWAIIITYKDDGYVKDSDADKIDYNKMLKDMQAATRDASKERVKEGFPSIEFVGWAEPPSYDKQTHKLYWARDLRFGNQKDDTLNYNIRVLGRRGVLVLNAVADMNDLPEIRSQAPTIVKMVEFNPGERYADFNHNTDKVAEYGLAALVAGGVLAKLGGFKLILAGLLAAKKFIVVGFIAVVGYLKRLFRPKTAAPTPAPLPPPDPPAAV